MEKSEAFVDIFPYLAIDVQARKIRFLGYIMPLTRAEFELLSALMFSESALDKQSLADAVSQRVKISSGSVSAHICSINKKARDMGGRNLVVMSRGEGYLMEKCP